MDVFYPCRVIKGVAREFVEFRKRYSKNESYSHALENSIVFMVDGSRGHGGLVDRFKGIISSYALSKVLGRAFRINYYYPFSLEKYLYPNKYDWILKEGEMTYDGLHACPKIFMGDTHPWRLLSLREEKRQVHMFYNRDVLSWINHCFGSAFTWKGLFEELFQKSPQLDSFQRRYLEIIGDEFVAVHFRFQHLLGGDFRELKAKILPENEARILRRRCLEVIREIARKHAGKRVLISSDNNDFLKIASEIPGTFIAEGRVSHCDNASRSFEEDSVLKLLGDFFLLSHAETVYSVKAREMYASEFPMYAALLGSCEFKRILI